MELLAANVFRNYSDLDIGITPDTTQDELVKIADRLESRFYIHDTDDYIIRVYEYVTCRWNNRKIEGREKE